MDIRKNSLPKKGILIFFIIYGVYGEGTDSISDWNIIFLLLPILLIPLTLFFFKQNEAIIEFKNISIIFFNKKIELLQKNQINNNDLFTNPVDINDNNIPNGNSVFLYICNKLYTITNDKIWLQKIEILKKSFHSLINSNFSSFIQLKNVLYQLEN